MIALNSEQQFSDSSRPFDADRGWIPSTYFGLRFTLPTPGYRQTAGYFKAKYDRLLAEEDRKQAQIRMTNDAEKLSNDYAKAVSAARFDEAIFRLKKDTYEKNFLSYQQGIQDLDQTLTSFQEMLHAEYDWISSTLAISLAQTSIDINNTIQ